MILTCPACQTRYVLPALKLGPSGRTVRCTRCGHQWHQDAPPDPVRAAEATATPPPLPNRPSATKPKAPANLPAVATAARKARRAVALSLFTALLIIVGVFGSLIVLREPLLKAAPMLAVLYQPFGLAPAAAPAAVNTGLQIINVLRDEKSEDGFVIFTISGEVENTNPTEKEVPNIRVSLLNERGVTLDSWRVQPEKRLLAPGERTTWVCYFYNPPLGQISETKYEFVN